VIWGDSMSNMAATFPRRALFDVVQAEPIGAPEQGRV